MRWAAIRAEFDNLRPYVDKYFTDIVVIDADVDNTAEMTSTPRLAARRDGDTGWHWYR